MTTPFQHFFDKLLLGLTVLQTTTVVYKPLTLLTYDWALSLPLEISLVWKSRWSLVKVLYLITRYLAFGDVTILVYQQLAFGMSAEKCRATYATFGWMFTTGFVLGELLLITRTWAVWARDRKLGIGLSIFYIGLVVPIYVNMAFFLKSLAFVDSIPGIPGCAVRGANNQLYIDWVLLMVLDVGVCSLMILRGYRSFISGGNSQLMKIVYGEGILYYVYLVALSLINVILILRLPREYIALLSSPMRSLHSILTCRVVLHTRQQAKVRTIVLGGSTIEGTRDTAPIGTLRSAEVEAVTSGLEEGWSSNARDHQIYFSAYYSETATTMMHQIPTSAAVFSDDIGRIFVHSHLGRWEPPRVSFQRSGHRGLPQGKDIRECLAARLRSFASLRLVCREWNATIDSALFRNIPLAFKSASPLLQSLSFLERHRDCVQSVLYSNQMYTWHADMEEAVGPLRSFFQSCPNLNTLLIHVPYPNLDIISMQIFHGAVAHVRVLHMEHLCTTYSRTALQCFLQEVGANLQKLEVRCWGKGCFGGRELEQIPRRIPYIHTLTLSGVNVSFIDIEKLFSRIRSKRSETKADGEIKWIVSCPLRRITLRQVVGLGEKEFRSLVVQPRIGFRLTALHLELARGEQISATFPITALKACPNLCEFTYDSPVPKTIFKYLPRTLEKVRIMVYPVGLGKILNLGVAEDFLTKVADIRKGIEGGPIGALRHLAVSCLGEFHGKVAAMQEEVQTTCIWKGVEVEWVWHWRAERNG